MRGAGIINDSRVNIDKRVAIFEVKRVTRESRKQKNPMNDDFSRGPNEEKGYIVGDRLIYSSTPQKPRKPRSGTDNNLAADSRHEAKPRGSGANRCHV